MSSRMCTVIFLRDSEGPVSLTSLRLKVSPDSSRKNTRKITIAAWLSKPITPIEPAHSQSLTLMPGRASAAAGLRTPRRFGSAVVACSISVAAACICCRVDGPCSKVLPSNRTSL